MKRYLLISVLILVLVAILFLFFGTKSLKENENTNVKIACNLPMTGDIAIYGESIRNGYSLAIEDLADLLKIHDIKLAIDYQDNHGVPRDAYSIMQKHLMDRFDIYISGVTQQTLAIKDKIDATKLPHVIWSFYPLVLSPNENLFRTWVNHEPYMFKDYLKKKESAKKIACVYLNAASGQELFNGIFIPLVKDDYEIVYNESFDIDNANFKDIVLKIKDKEPDVIFVNGFKNHIVQIAKEFNINEVKKDGNIVFTFDLLDAIPELSQDILEGFVTIIPKYVISKNEKQIMWDNKYRNRFKREPTYTDAYAYDCLTMICHAIKSTKTNQEISLLDALRQINVDGITGRLSFEPNGQLKSNSAVCVMRSGEFSILDIE